MLRTSCYKFLPLFVGALVAFLIVANPATAQSKHDQSTHGPKVGVNMASALEGAIDQDKTQQNLKTLRGKNGLILLFSRSFDW